MSEKIKIMIVDDIESIVKKYLSIFERIENIEVVATANDGYDAVLKSAIYKPDIILMDIEMEDKYAGIVATKKILKEFPNIKIIILTVSNEDDLIFSAFQAGVCDFVQKNASPAAVIKSVTDAHKGDSPIRPSVAGRIREEFKRIKNYEESLIYTLYLLQQLTDTEQKILTMLNDGLSQKDICKQHYIENTTLKTHLRNIKKKFNSLSIHDVLRQLESSGFFECIDLIRQKKYDPLTNKWDK